MFDGLILAVIGILLIAVGGYILYCVFSNKKNL